MALWRLRPAAKGQWLPLGRCVAAALRQRACCGAKVRSALWSDLFGQQPAEAAPGRTPALRAVAEAASGRGAGQRARQASGCKTASRREPTGRPLEQAAPAPAPALGLPAGADRGDRDRSQHSRHPWSRRLRRRGSGAAGGRGAAGQAAGRGEAGGDPALRHGVGDRGLGPHRHRAAGAGLGSAISGLENFDSFECRGRNRVAGAQLSEHGRANALDVRALKLANGQSISLTDRMVPRELRENVLHSVCARFTTVLGPGSDGYHEDHIHLDLMERRNNYKICQWNVLDPLPPIAPLLPAERPDEAPPREVATKRLANPTPRSRRRRAAAGTRRVPPTKKRR